MKKWMKTRAILACGLAILVLTGVAARSMAGDAEVKPPAEKGQPSAKRVPLHLVIYSGQSNVKGITLSRAVEKLKEAFPDHEFVKALDRRPGQPILIWYADAKTPDKQAYLEYYKKKRKDATDEEIEKRAAGAAEKTRKRRGSWRKWALQGFHKPLRGRTPDIITFFWMQGESDGMFPGLAPFYAENLKGFLAQMREDLKSSDINFVIARISDARIRSEAWKHIRQVQQEVAEADPLVEWFDTDDLNNVSPTSDKRSGDGVHYPKWGLVKLGERFAEKAIALTRKSQKQEDTDKPAEVGK